MQQSLFLKMSGTNVSSHKYSQPQLDVLFNTPVLILTLSVGYWNCGDEGPGNNSAGETAIIFSKPSVLLNRSFSFQKYYKLEKFIEQAYLNSNVNKALLEGPDFKGKVAREIRTMIKVLYHSSRPYKDLKDSFTKHHNHLRANRLDGTCTWFIGSQSFGSWLAGGSPRLLWCYGAPGRGKSTIA